MCLNLIKEEPKIKFKKKWITAYKFYQVKKSNLISPYMNCVVSGSYSKRDGYEINSGRIKKLSQEEKRQKAVDEGIHVFLKKQDAIKAMKAEKINPRKEWATYPLFVVIAVQCLQKDLIATGQWSNCSLGNIPVAVFKKIHISRSEYMKINIHFRIKQMLTDVKMFLKK